MSTNFPTSKDVFANPQHDSKRTDHAAQHANANDAIEALEDKVGITGSTDPNSLTKQIADLDSDIGTVESTVLGALSTHTSNTSNPHSVTKTQVGLGNVENIAQLSADIYDEKKGSLLVGVANTSGPGELTAGTTDQILMADEEEALGMRWADKSDLNLYIDNLVDVETPIKSDGYVLTWDEANDVWISAALPTIATDLNDLDDVVITTPVNNDILKYDSASGHWINGAGGSGGGMTDPMTATGDIIYRNSSGGPDNLAIGNYGDLLSVNGGIPAWLTAAQAGIVQGHNVSGDNTSGTIEAVNKTIYINRYSETGMMNIAVPEVGDLNYSVIVVNVTDYGIGVVPTSFYTNVQPQVYTPDGVQQSFSTTKKGVAVMITCIVAGDGSSTAAQYQVIDISDGWSIRGTRVDNGAISDKKVLMYDGSNSKLIYQDIGLGAWQSWTPTFANFTKGSATVDAKYIQIGKTVHFRLRVVLSSSTMSTAPTFTLPVTSINYSSGNVFPIGIGTILDSGTATYRMNALWSTTTTAVMVVTNAGSTYASDSNITSSVPMTWANNDSFTVMGTYEAA